MIFNPFELNENKKHMEYDNAFDPDSMFFNNSKNDFNTSDYYNEVDFKEYNSLAENVKDIFSSCHLNICRAVA